jgi:Zn-dependent M28 family amino/carboxypeptidase
MKKFLMSLACLGLVACDGAGDKSAAVDNTGRAALDVVELTDHIKTLASDEFEGRAPSSPGEVKTINYMATSLKASGFLPGNGDSYFQEVPVVAIEADANTSLTVKGAGKDDLTLAYDKDVVMWTKRVVDRVEVSDSELVFVGYGIVAPEYNWNDYAGLDAKGKTIVVLVNDPGYATQDETVFNGNAMTYYGRYTYKYEEAMRQGAEAVLIVHKTEDAAYPWAVVQSSWEGSIFTLDAADGNMGRLKVESWIKEASVRPLFERAGLDFDALKNSASKPGFKNISLNQTISMALDNEIIKSTSNNVVAVLPGSETPDEYFIYMGHWDHFGIKAAIDGDNIYNGALDNATGTAGLLELAQAFGSMPVAPKRSIIIMSPTAEEQGLLGSEHFGQNPTVPVNQIVAGLNIDGMVYFGPTKDVSVTGFGASELDVILKKYADKQSRYLAPDSEPEKGYYYRSDHFNLAKVGVPMIYPGSGIDHVEKGKEYGIKMGENYVANLYHKPADEYLPSWDMSGAVLDLQLYFDVGLDVANSSTWPNWVMGNEFRAIRDKSLAKARK